MSYKVTYKGTRYFLAMEPADGAEAFAPADASMIHAAMDQNPELAILLTTGFCSEHHLALIWGPVIEKTWTAFGETARWEVKTRMCPECGEGYQVSSDAGVEACEKAMLRAVLKRDARIHELERRIKQLEPRDAVDMG